MKHVKLDPMNFPMVEGEGWWIVHPNNGSTEFKLPDSAVTVCIDNLEDFKQHTMYRVGLGSNDGWINVFCKEGIYEMPQYVFARHFDAEVFVRGIPTDKRIKELSEVFHDHLEVLR